MLKPACCGSHRVKTRQTVSYRDGTVVGWVSVYDARPNEVGTASFVYRLLGSRTLYCCLRRSYRYAPDGAVTLWFRIRNRIMKSSLSVESVFQIFSPLVVSGKVVSRCGNLLSLYAILLVLLHSLWIPNIFAAVRLPLPSMSSRDCVCIFAQRSVSTPPEHYNVGAISTNRLGIDSQDRNFMSIVPCGHTVAAVVSLCMRWAHCGQFTT